MNTLEAYVFGKINTTNYTVVEILSTFNLQPHTIIATESLIWNVWITAIRRRLRRPTANKLQQETSSVSDSSASASATSAVVDMETSASVNKFKVRNRVATRKSGTESSSEKHVAKDNQDEGGYKVSKTVSTVVQWVNVQLYVSDHLSRCLSPIYNFHQSGGAKWEGAKSLHVQISKHNAVFTHWYWTMFPKKKKKRLCSFWKHFLTYTILYILFNVDNLFTVVPLIIVLLKNCCQNCNLLNWILIMY